MVVINTMYYQCRDRQANVVELESPATDRNTSGNLVYNRSGSKTQWGKKNIVNKCW